MITKSQILSPYPSSVISLRARPNSSLLLRLRLLPVTSGQAQKVCNGRACGTRWLSLPARLLISFHGKPSELTMLADAIRGDAMLRSCRPGQKASQPIGNWVKRFSLALSACFYILQSRRDVAMLIY